MNIHIPELVQNSNNIDLSLFYNNETLNIFSDASMRNMGNNSLSSCYGSVAVCCDTIINEIFRLQSVSTVPAAEIRGIRCSLTLALSLRNRFKVINIFSDSKLALCGLRDYIYKWHYNTKTGRYVNTSNEVANQELYIECFKMVEELRLTNVVNLFHQRGHIDNKFNDIKKATDSFKSVNGINGNIDYSVIRYISTYNNYVDNKSRSMIKRSNVIDNNYYDPITFVPNDHLFLN